MRVAALKLCAVLVAALAAPDAGLAQSLLRGTVREDSSGRPLAGVEVLVMGTPRRVTTDAAGRFAFAAPPAGRRIVLFRALGYRPVHQWVLLGLADTVVANALMVPAPVELAPIEVTGRADGPPGTGLDGFAERKRLGLGLHFDSTDLMRRGSMRLGQFLGGGTRTFRAASARKPGPMGGDELCFSSVYLDGAQLYRSPGPAIRGGAGSGPPPEEAPDLNQFEVAALAAVEIYRGAAEVPVEYGGASAACGVILLWSRRN